MSITPGPDEARFETVRTDWFRGAEAEDWQTAFDRMVDEWRVVDWRSGGRTLLAALGLQYQEVPLCRGLAWLFDPAGGHGLGRGLVDEVLRDLGLPVIDDAPVDVRVEESIADTRADIVLRVGEQTVIFEAKVFASEQPAQADRLYEHWQHLKPTLVFLTRTGYAPHTAMKSVESWVSRTWRDLAQIARTASERAEPSWGAREFIETIGAL